MCRCWWQALTLSYSSEILCFIFLQCGEFRGCWCPPSPCGFHIPICSKTSLTGGACEVGVPPWEILDPPIFFHLMLNFVIIVTKLCDQCLAYLIRKIETIEVLQISLFLCWKFLWMWMAQISFSFCKHKWYDVQRKEHYPEQIVT